MRNVRRLVANHSEQFRRHVHKLGHRCQHCHFLPVGWRKRISSGGKQVCEGTVRKTVSELDLKARKVFWNNSECPVWMVKQTALPGHSHFSSWGSQLGAGP